MTTTLVELSNVHLWFSLASVTAIVLVVIAIYKAVYRLQFSPLSKIPGPRLASLSTWYQIYYNVYLPGQLTLHIEDLHKQYGRNTILISPHITSLYLTGS